jgi:CzcA family heavy metal efflux pump
MLSSIVGFSLRRRWIIIVLACLLLGYGVYSLEHARYDVFPEFAPPEVTIQTESPGLSSEQVELLVTQPIENAVSGILGVKTVRSSSIQGLSVITAVFNSGTDILLDRQLVSERLSTISGSLPGEAKSPVIVPLTSSTSIAMVIGLTSEKLSLMELRTDAEWTVKQRLMAVPGVAKVVVHGGEERQFQVQILPDRLIKYGVSLDEVLSAARRATGIRGAGFSDTGNQRITLRTQGAPVTAAGISDTVVSFHGGAPLKLKDVANVVEAPAPPVGSADVMTRPGVQLLISEQYGANTLEVTKGIDKALGELRPALASSGITARIIFRPANFINTALGNLKTSLLIGAILAVAVLFLFLFNLRAAAVSCTAIPLSLLAASIVLDRLGFGLNMMTIGGLAIAIGEVVDDAVIDVENIMRRLGENRRAEHPSPVWEVVRHASLEVRSAVVYATFAVMLIFVPILTMSGVAGRLFAPLGIAYIFAVLASLSVALTVVPALSFLLLPHGLKEKEPPVVGWLKKRYTSVLEGVEKHFRVAIAIAAVLTAAGLLLVFLLGGTFLPELHEGHYIVHMNMFPGTSLEESMRLGRRVSRELLKIPYIRSVGQRAGRAPEEDDIHGTHQNEIEVDLKQGLSGNEIEEARGSIQKTLSEFPGANFAADTFLTERIGETISGYVAPVVINIYGNDLGDLDEKANEVATVLNGIRGASGVRAQSVPGLPEMTISLKKDSLARWGFKPVSVMDAIRTSYQGAEAGKVYEGNRSFDVTVILPPGERSKTASVGDLTLRSPSGVYVRLRQLADIREVPGRYIILHQGTRRVQTVTCSVTGRDLNSFVAEAEKKILAEVRLPAGGYFVFTGAAQAEAKSRRDLIVHSLMAGVGIILLLSIVTGFRNLLLLILNVPFALVGGVIAVLVSGGELSLGSMVGFVTLFGITLRNSIMLISHYEHLVSVEGMQWGTEVSIRGASERLAPILMTALVTALGLLPLALASNAPGREIESPLAVVILGGLFTSTALNLLLLPALALRYGKFGRDEKLLS